jgi:hypothetical protein
VPFEDPTMLPPPGATPEPPMTRTYVAVVIVEVLVLLALWTLQQRYSL